MIDFMHDINLSLHDVRILELLQENTLLPKHLLADKVGLSESQCFRRIKRLEESGLIERYKAVINLERAGFDVSVAVMVQYRKSEPDARDSLLQLIQETAVIQECYAVTGEYDFLLRVYCKSMKEFSQLINETFQKSYISGIHSYMLTECLKSSCKLPI